MASRPILYNRSWPCREAILSRIVFPCPKFVQTLHIVTLHGHTNIYGTENSGGHSIHYVLSQVKVTWNIPEVKQTILLFIAKHKGCPKCGSTTASAPWPILLGLALLYSAILVNLNKSYALQNWVYIIMLWPELKAQFYRIYFRLIQKKSLGILYL